MPLSSRRPNFLGLHPWTKLTKIHKNGMVMLLKFCTEPGIHILVSPGGRKRVRARNTSK